MWIVNSTFITPGRSPRVLDQPEVLSILAAIADGQHTVIKILSVALGLIVNTYERQTSFDQIDSKFWWSLLLHPIPKLQDRWT